MSRRRLETALQVGRSTGKVDISTVKVKHEVLLDRDSGGVFSFQFSHDSNKLATGQGNGGIQVFDTDTGKLQSTVRNHRYGGLPVLALRWHPKHQETFLAASSDGKLYSCNPTDVSCQEVAHEPKNEINCLDFCMDGWNYATAGKDLAVRLYDSKTNQMIREYLGTNNNDNYGTSARSGHGQRVFALRYHPESNDMFITGGWENHLKIWDMRVDVGVRRTIPGPHICGDALDMKECSQNYDILSGSWVANNALQIWDYTEGTLTKTVPYRHTDAGCYLYCAQFCDNDMVLAGGSGTNSVQAINCASNKVVGEIQFDKPVNGLDSTRGGSVFACGSNQGFFRLCSMT